MPAPRLSIVAGALSADPRIAMADARRIGFDAIEFDSIAGSLDLTTLSATGARDFRHALNAHNLTLAALRSNAGPDGLGHRADIDRLLARLTAVLTAARALGAPVVCLEVGALPAAPRTVAPKPAIDPANAGALIIPDLAPAPPSPPQKPIDAAAWAAVDTALSAIGELADRIGPAIALRGELSDFDALHRAIVGARCASIALDLDTASALIDDWKLDDIFDRLGPRLRHVRARDARAGAGQRLAPTPIGAGNVPWDHLLSNLDAADFIGHLGIDPAALPDPPAAARAARSFLSSR